MSSTDESHASSVCQWCSEPVPEGETHCPTCGAATVLRESIGGLVIPGVTHVDPALAAYAAQPHRIPRASPSQSIAGPAVGAAAILGGPVGLAALGGLAAVAGAEYLAAGADNPRRDADLDKLGQPSGAVLDMIRQLDEKLAPPDPNAPAGQETAAEGQPDKDAPPPGRSD